MPKKGDHIDLKNQQFGRLTVLEFDGVRGRRKTYWKCICDCGNVVSVDTAHLRSGHTKSCGCYKVELISNLNKKTGLSNSNLGFSYRNMKNRCFWKKSPMYKNYGERGITVCEEWLDRECGFENFVDWALKNGYSEGLTLDRIDVNGNYCPQNCRWVDKYVQANNKRKNYYLKINGEIDTVGNWARRLNVSYWNLLHYSKGGKNMKYPDLEIEAVQNGL
jgi:hypothetical protein